MHFGLLGAEVNPEIVACNIISLRFYLSIYSDGY